MKTIEQQEAEATIAMGKQITELEQELARATRRIAELELIIVQQGNMIRELS